MKNDQKHPMSYFNIQVGNILAYYCYEAGNSLQTQHFYVDGVKKLTLPHADFLRVCDAIHAEPMVQGAGVNCDESEENQPC